VHYALRISRFAFLLLLFPFFLTFGSANDGDYLVLSSEVVKNSLHKENFLSFPLCKGDIRGSVTATGISSGKGKSVLALSGQNSDYFVKLAIKNVDFRLPEAERLVIDGKVLNPQVLSGCAIENIVPIHRLSIERAGNYLVQLKVRCKNSFLTRTLNINLKVDAEVEGYMTTETVEKGDYLSGRVKKGKFLLSRIRGNIFNGDIDKVVARVKLLPNTIILQRFVEVPFAIKRGELIKIVAEKNGIYVETTGRALQNGHIGDTIKVKNVYSRKVIEGKVKDEKTVVVGF